MTSTTPPVGLSNKKKSFSFQTTAATAAAARGTPNMGIITSVGIRCFSPSSSLSAYAGGSWQHPKTPTGFSIGPGFGEAHLPKALDKVGIIMSDQASFASVPHSGNLYETFDRSPSMSVLLGVGYGNRQVSFRDLKGEGATTDVVLPIYTAVTAFVDSEDDEDSLPLFGKVQGPLGNSHDLPPTVVGEGPKQFADAALAEASTTQELKTSQRTTNALLHLAEPHENEVYLSLQTSPVGHHAADPPVGPVNNFDNSKPTPIVSLFPTFNVDEGIDVNNGGALKGATLPSFRSNLKRVASNVKAPPRSPQPPVTLREATPEDAEGIIALRDSLDMTNATSFVWELEDMRQRIATRYPLVLVALSPDPREDSPTKGADMVVGVSGIDVHGMEKDFPITAIGSRLLGVPAGTEYTFPSEYCMCRGLLIHPLFQGAGLGSKLHKGRLKLLAEVMPDASVILSARGSTLEETLSAITPHIDSSDSPGTPVFTKDDLFEFTFHTSQGIVHMVHGKDDGWKFVGVDIADGGPVWLTSRPLKEMVRSYDTKVEGTSNFALRRIPSLIVVSSQ